MNQCVNPKTIHHLKNCKDFEIMKQVIKINEKQWAFHSRYFISFPEKHCSSEWFKCVNTKNVIFQNAFQ